MILCEDQMNLITKKNTDIAYSTLRSVVEMFKTKSRQYIIMTPHYHKNERIYIFIYEEQLKMHDIYKNKVIIKM
jgi:hypothetical protein